MSAALVAATDVNSASAQLDTRATTTVLPAAAPALAVQFQDRDENLSLGSAPQERTTSTPAPSTAELAVDQEVPAPSLAALVEREQADEGDDDLDSETRCLATAVYYEARSESLTGKHAVARVVINRSHSGRFPTSLCGVVTQPGQFSFVHRGQMPSANKDMSQWDDSVAVARVALANAWKKNPAEGALYFHARRVSPRWNRTQLAQIDNHLFYR
jgi:spore germination cell wall hydrolase CwlJ-like protein